MTNLSKIISWVFMPLFLPMLALITVLFIPSNNPFCFNQECLYMLPEPAKWALIYMFSIFLVLAPGLSFIIMYRWNMIDTIEMDNREERNLPIIVMFLYSLVLYLAIVWMSPEGMPRFIISFPLSGVLVTASFYAMNKWKKVSIHAAAAGIATGLVLAYTLSHTYYPIYPLIIFIMISGIVMSARLYLDKHTIDEVGIGWLTGLFITFITVYFF